MSTTFEVGRVYANRIGSYEVVRIDHTVDMMEVRYVDNGEAAELNINIQQRIWDNMQIDEQEQVRQAAIEETRFVKGFGENFTGLVDSDFKNDTEGTTWRSRQGLAGRVARKLTEASPHTFTSWAIYRWPVALLTHRENYQMAAFELGSRKAKFTIETNYESILCGFYIERGPGFLDSSWDWPILISAMESRPELVEIIRRAEADAGIRFIGRKSQGDERFHFTNGPMHGSESLWNEVNTSATTLNTRLALLQTIPGDHWGEIYMLAEMPKQKAIELSVGITDRIVDTMILLLPIYQAAVSLP